MPLERCIGSGGFAAVWQIAGRDSVLKVAHANHELARARMRREAEAMAGVGAPAVPAMRAHGVLDDGRAWIEMERVTGTNLGDIIASGSLRVEVVIALGIRLAEALAAIHDKGYAHRDLKPDNIVRRADGSLVILDLGLARVLPDDPDDPNRAGVQVGSVEYMAPEQALDATTARGAADIYALGCILYELCSGRLPFVGDAGLLERAHAALRPPPVSTFAVVPASLDQLIAECLAKQPSRRPSSAGQIADRLRQVVGEIDSAQRTQHSMSVIGAGKQPVVLLWAELPKVDRALIGTLTARKVTIVSQRGRRLLGGIAGGEQADPAGAAIAAARDLAAAGARVALHLDAVTVIHSPTGLQLAGPSIDKPEDWLPGTPWTGVIMTRTLATIAQVPTRPSEQSGFMVMGDPSKPSEELFGRDAFLADLVAEAAAALSGLGPGLALVIGDHGIGKTAIARALVPQLSSLGVGSDANPALGPLSGLGLGPLPGIGLGARVVSTAVPPPGSGRPGHSALAQLVGAKPEGPIVRAVGDALRSAARQRPLAIILDELHLAEHELLDALEYATLGGEALPLWVLALAAPRLDQRRPGFGQRAERSLRVTLPPLGDEAALKMTAALLHPAEYPPLRALRQIAAIARGNPMHLSTLTREIHDRGAIRTRPNGEHFLDTTTLESLPPIALGPWLAARELATLGVELVSLARVCATLGGEIDREEITAVIGIAERRGSATTTVDLDVGLGELVSHQILSAGPGGWTFRQALLEEGIYATTNETERAALHAAALEYWQTKSIDDPAVAARIARHAETIGEKRIAAAAFARTGLHAHEEHRSLDADQAWQGAVRNLDTRDADRARALLGRARARYRLQRVRDALSDLEEVLAIASELDEHLLVLEALLEKATALDWGDDYEASAAAAKLAQAKLRGDEPDGLVAEIDLAIARSIYREGRFADAVPLLERVIEASRGVRPETEIVATVLLAPALVESHRLEDAEAVFTQLIARCRDSGDLTHLGAAYANRTWLWADRGEIERVETDLGTVIQIARESGQASLERIATYNLAENRLWQGRLDEAINLARRSLTLQRGHGEGAIHFDQLLLARIHAARGERDELASVVAALEDSEISEGDRKVLAVLQCALDPAANNWQPALAALGDSMLDLRIELAHLALHAGKLDAEVRAQLRAELAAATKHSIWMTRSEL